MELKKVERLQWRHAMNLDHKEYKWGLNSWTYWLSCSTININWGFKNLVVMCLKILWKIFGPNLEVIPKCLFSFFGQLWEGPCILYAASSCTKMWRRQCLPRSPIYHFLQSCSSCVSLSSPCIPKCSPNPNLMQEIYVLSAICMLVCLCLSQRRILFPSGSLIVEWNGICLCKGDAGISWGGSFSPSRDCT